MRNNNNNTEKFLVSVIDRRKIIKRIIDDIGVRNKKRPQGLLTGFNELDRFLCGLRGGNLIVIAGHPCIGVTSFALGICEYLGIKNNIPVLYFSMEMCKERLLERMMASHAHIDLLKINKGKLHKSDWDRLKKTDCLISEKPIYVDDTPRLTVDEIRDRAKKVKKHKDIKCLVIDYFQIMRSKHSTYLDEKTTAEICQKLKVLAVELNIPVILLAQLDNDLIIQDEGRHQPMVKDLGEAILLDRFADVLVLINRESYYDFKSTASRDADVIITRNRNGPTGIVALNFYQKYARFENVV